MRDDIIFDVEQLGIDAVSQDGRQTPIVKDINFQVPRGKVVALIGESGSGKTTIALSALGYCKPGLNFATGEARLNGRDVTKLPLEELRTIRGTEVAYLAQSAAATFNPALTINEQVTETVLIRGRKTKEEARARAIELYAALELPDPEIIGDRYPHQVSGGQLQRLMAAMALSCDPKLLVLDEPTTALDVTTQIEVLKVFKKVINEEGAAAIYVTHDLALVAQISDYVVVLYQGEVQERGPTGSVINNPKHAYTQKLLSAVRPTPHAARETKAAGEHITEGTALEVRDVTAGYNGLLGRKPAKIVLSDVDMTVPAGSTIGIIGESGSGKSTLARVVAGLLPPAEGDVLLDDNVLPGSYSQRKRDDLRQVQFVYQMADTALNPRHKVSDILGRPLDFYLGLKGKQKRRRITELLELVDLGPEFAHRLPHELSGGQKQRINLARALAAEPRIILCDEVTSALDSIVAANIILLLKRLQRELGVSFVFISHDLSTVSFFADTIIVLYNGRVVERGTIYDVLNPPFHPYTQLLISSTPELQVGWLERIGEAQAKSISNDLTLMEDGCPYFKRCPHGIKGLCDIKKPPVRSLPGKPSHTIECHLELEVLSQ